MEVIKVIVDKLPEGCTNCDFDDYMADNALGECMILGREFEPGNSFLRPDWCPLVVEDRYSVALQACLDLVDTMNGIDLDSLRATWEKAFFASIEIDRDSDPQ
jgi:hypothetical protein